MSWSSPNAKAEKTSSSWPVPTLRPVNEMVHLDLFSGFGKLGTSAGEAGNSGRWRSSSLSSSTTAVDDSTEGAGQKGEDQAPPPTQPEKKARRGVPGGYKSYSPDSLETAYRVYRDSAHLGNTVSIRRLAKVSGIPYATLRDHINGRRGPCQGSARDRKEQRIQQIQSLAPHFKGLF